MDPEIRTKLAEMDGKIDSLRESVEKTQKYIKYIFITAVVALALTVLPLIGLLFAVPSFISTYSELSNF